MMERDRIGSEQLKAYSCHAEAAQRSPFETLSVPMIFGTLKRPQSRALAIPISRHNAGPQGAGRGTRRSCPGDARQPGQDSVGTHPAIEFGGLDRIYLPSLVEAGPDFGPGYPARSESPRLTVTEAQHEVAAAWRDHRAEVLDEGTAVVVVEDVEQAAIQHSVELLIERSQLKGVMEQEVRGRAAVAGFGFSKSNCGRSRIDASGLQSHAGGHERVLACPATHVQDPASNSACFRQRQKGGLRPPDIPRGRAGIGGVKILRPPRPHGARQLLGGGGRRLISSRGFHVRAPHVSLWHPTV